MENAFNAPHFINDEAARKMIEGIRWPSGPICPHCGVIGHSYATKRIGLYRCAEPECRKDFSVTTGTVMERSKIALHKWMMGFYLMCSSKKGICAHQLHRTLGITYQAAWFMCHRIREAMRDGGLVPMGGEVHTNTIESTFSVFKRGMKGIYQHCAEKHLHRYLAEFDFRYNHRAKLGISDFARTMAAVKGVEGKRLTYRRSNAA